MVKLAFNPDEVTLGLSVNEQPRYSLREAAGYLSIPKTTLASWFFGTTYNHQGKKVPFAAVLVPADPQSRLLSFDNLVEAYVLRRFRQRDEMGLRAISAAMALARSRFGTKKPLLEKTLLKSGKSLFLQAAGEVVGLSDPSQLLLPNAESFFERVKYADDAAAELYPLTRPNPKDSPQIVCISPQFSFGRAIISRTKVQTAILAARYLNGDSIAELAEDYGCKPAEVEESLRAEWIFAHGQAKRAA